LRRPLVGVGPITYFDPRIWPQSDDAIYKRYLEKLACFLIWLIDQGYGLLFFPGEAVHDRWVIDDLLQLLAQRDITPDGRRLAAPAIETTDTLIAHLAAVDCVVTSRFHGVLLAQLLEKPCVALSYHEKIDVLMDEMGQAAYSLPIGEFSVEQLYERFMSLQANSARVQKQLRSKNQEKRRALEEQYTRIFK
jgi:polysaccharide pyruvyl transferase WcaK-like protein